MEKFAIRKAQRFLDQGNNLVLPGLELIYVWNGFKILGKYWHLVEPIYVLVENTMKRLEAEKGKRPFFEDDICLVTLLQGMCLKNMKSPLQAEECFRTVVKNHGKLARDTYLVPYAMSEIAILYMEQENLTGALDLLEKTK